MSKNDIFPTLYATFLSPMNKTKRPMSTICTSALPAQLHTGSSSDLQWEQMTN